MKLNIIMPGIRPCNWGNVFNSIPASIGPYDWHLYAIGPKEPTCDLDPQYFTYVKDYGSPARCFQIGSLLCEEDSLLMLFSDDGVANPRALEECVDLYKELCDDKVIISLTYLEGLNFQGRLELMPYKVDSGYHYYNPGYHADLRLDGIVQDWITCPLFMLSTKRFRELGGLDSTMFHHCNMSNTDMAIRNYKDGGRCVLSPNLVGNFDWSHVTDPSTSGILQKAYQYFDYPNFKRLYETKEAAKDRIVIDYMNWVKSNPLWELKYNAP